MKGTLYTIASLVTGTVFLLTILVLAIFLRGRTVSKLAEDTKPRLLWGCTPLTNIKYLSEAMRQRGYFSQTFVSTFYATIAERRDFDLYRYELFGIYRWIHRYLVLVIEPYLSFVYLLFKFDVFHFFYDGGILARTPLRFIEVQLLHGFGKKVVVMPYGADVHVLPLMRNNVYRFGQLYHYGANLVRGRRTIERWIDYFSKYADCCIGSIYFDALYRWDILPVSYLAIDVELFYPPGDYQYRNDGRNGPVVVAHTPNHRVIKGTEYIVAAVERLRSEGYQIEFHLLERLKNTEVRKILERTDILIELLVSGYGLSGIEGMALAKPVISNFQGDTSVLRYYSYFNECPIVQADIDTVYEKLKWLVDNPESRKAIGLAGRSYVEKYHSYYGLQLMWEQIYKKIWHGADVDLMFFYHPLCGEFTKLYNARLANRS